MYVLVLRVHHWKFYSLYYSQQKEKDEEDLMKKKDEEKTKRKGEPGFNSRWYTDPDAHLKENERQEKDEAQLKEDEERKCVMMDRCIINDFVTE